ncbi:PadR family transcriptional regulator [Sphaerisporangium fuscum]|uniref:PadR family transcriptional regulator n=1 Tax=Sphaerisporangium fuscum TaxID=2835868 RepID=UPI001BDC4874|nr:PadR family transcriptional regulator [Sphaerisporangium fuscum]
MAKKRKVGNLLALAVLSHLTERPMHPYELGRTLQDRGDSRSIKFNHGSLYMVVQQLAKAGFIAEQETSRDGQRPERTVYALTDAGRTELREWLRELVETPEHEYPQFVSALSLIGALPPGEVVELLGRRLSHLAEQRAGIQAEIDKTLAQGVPELFIVEERFRVTLLDAESSFVERFVKSITEPEGDWVKVWDAFHSRQPSSGEPLS